VTYRVEFEPAAAKALGKLERPVQKRIQGVLDVLALTPRPPAAKKLVGSELWRVRTGDYRIVYAIEDDRLLVVVVKVGHRREVYDR
jgi:mRNA interferase RelE/StbE